MSWDALSLDDLRATVDPAVVIAAELGVVLADDGDRLVGLCPFHDDTRPSFAVFGRRAGCWSCGWRGDVFDIIRAARECTFRQAVSAAAEYAGQTHAARVNRQNTEFDPGDLRRAVRAAQRAARWDLTSVSAFLERKNLAIPADWLIERWRVGTFGDGTIVAPHYADEQVTGYKVRTADEHWKAAAGSRFPALYGAWRHLPPGRPVVLCEGETDAWWVDWVVGDWAAVLSLPVGAHTTRSAWIESLVERRVIVATDHDAAGDEAAAGWLARLPNAVRADLPMGADCAAVTDPDELQERLFNQQSVETR